MKSSLLPARTNQKMNEYLKEIGAICNIKKEPAFHTARHTFATTMLNNGVSMEQSVICLNMLQSGKRNTMPE